MLKPFILFVFFLFLPLLPASADNLVGRASVIDADTVEIHGKRIRLHAIDAPESSQLCRDGSGADYRCGQQASLALADFIGTRPISCETTDIDRYQRIVAICSVGGADMNAWLVEKGHALAYRQYGRDYVSQEDRAREAGRGIWAGEFVAPGDLAARKEAGERASNGLDAGCQPSRLPDQGKHQQQRSDLPRAGQPPL